MRQFVVGDKVRRKKEEMDFWWEGKCKKHNYPIDSAFTVTEIIISTTMSNSYISIAEMPGFLCLACMEHVNKKCISL